MTTVMKIAGMSCQHCVAHVKEALAQVSGVRSVQVELAPGTATVEHEGADAAALCAAVEEAGYDVVA